MPTRILFVAGLALLLAAGGCANPIAPSGGPRDETPPSVRRSTPARDAVNVSAKTIRIEFSEYVERSSLVRAFSINPAFERRLEFDWDGRAVDVELPAPLRDSTTYIVTIDTELSDAHGVSLDEPIQYAFSTGDRINQGQIAGTVVEPKKGEPQGQVDVYAYPAPRGTPPEELPDRPAYRTQTGSDGTFSLEYLREQFYYVVAVSDGNRNRAPDVLEPVAPPPQPVIYADSASTAVPVPWTITRVDTIAPELRRIQPGSNQRFTMRFSEPVEPTLDPEAWIVRDSIPGTRVPVDAVYTTGGTATEVLIRTAEPMREARHVVVLDSGIVADTLGTPIASTTAGFDAAAREDTLSARFGGFLPDDLAADSTGAVPLLPGVEPGGRFNQPPDSARLAAALAVLDTAGTARSYELSTGDGVRYRLQTDPPLTAGQFLEVRVDATELSGTDTTYASFFRRVTERALGELEGEAYAVDTLAARSDAAAEGSSPGETPPDTAAARPDAPRPDAPRPDAPRSDTARADTIEAGGVNTDTLEAATPDTDTPDTDTPDTDTPDTDTPDTNRPDADTSHADTSHADTTEAQPTGRPAPAPVDSSLLVGPVVVELTADEASPPVDLRTLTLQADSTFLFGEIPDGTYRFRAFVDRNGNGRWDPGRVLPYRRPEPVTWSAQPTDSRPRWTTVLPAPLRIPVLARPERAPDASTEN